MKVLLLATAAAVLGSAAVAQDLSDADVVFLGEVHDNPAHHARQAELVTELSPTALVFEMLTEAQAARIKPPLIKDQDALEAALEWAGSGWPDFSMYYPIFAAAPDAAFYGAAIPRDEARRAMADGVVAVFGEGADLFALDQPLPEDQQDAREALQMSAHCDALPADMLPFMVSVQRLRDAALARAALAALDQTGGPVAVITGNGHARADWGAPAALAEAAPDVVVRSVGLGETATGAPPGRFDVVEITETVDRDDPCAAFRDAS